MVRKGKRRKRKTCTGITKKMKKTEIFSGNDDLMTEILCRLPIKSLFRFKCISKQWHSLISHPAFPQNHSFHHPPPDSSISGFFIQLHWSVNDFPIEFAPIDKSNSGVPDPSLSFLGRGFSILNSCNGLLLCSRYIRGHGGEITYCVCNPTTMEYVLLPKPTAMSIQCIGIAFDPSKSPHYKVVCLSDTKHHHIHVDIYSSQTGSWRPSVESLHESYGILYEKGVFWNGALHWTYHDESSLSFHVEREFLQTIKLPPKPSNRLRKYFGESNGHLYLIETNNNHSTEFDIFEMECDYSQWSFRYHVNLYEVSKIYPQELWLQTLVLYTSTSKPWKFTILHLLQGGGGEVLLIYIPGKIISYRITDGTFEKYCDLDLLDVVWPEFRSYSNTLSSVQSSSL